MPYESITEDLTHTPGVINALLLSGDGGPLSYSNGVSDDTAGLMAAALSAIQATSRHVAALCHTRSSTWDQSVIQFGDRCLYLFAAGEDTYLAVAAIKKADPTLVTHNAKHAVIKLRGHNS
ncbi:roadblock/LC7 domain-containing protein [Streptomyces sp. NPDC059679]|uniref:roadblock/LC7 domain-containing protein n=1 Tax=Streptomyces sp. NPDC059679 TaxID=3346903 RepID=UPI0036AE8413